MTTEFRKNLEDTIKELEELNEREERKLNSNKLLVDNPVLGDIEILNYDKQKHLALILICNNTLEPYVIADGFDVSDGTWGAGTYFRTIESADRGYRKALNHKMDESMYYQETIKYLIMEDLSDMKLTEKEVDLAFDYLMNESNSPTIINENDVDEIRECVERYRDEIFIEQRKLKQEKLSNEKVRDWCLREDRELAKEYGDKIDPNITFSELFNLSIAEDYEFQIKLLGIHKLNEFKAGDEYKHFDFIDLCRKHYFQEIKDEPYYTCSYELRHKTLKGYHGYWKEIDSAYRIEDKYYLFEEEDEGEYWDEPGYVLTDEIYEPIGSTRTSSIEEALDDFEIGEEFEELSI